MNSRRPTPRRSTIRMAKVKDKEIILKAARMKQVTYKGNITRLDCSEATLQYERGWLKKRNLQPRILYPARLIFRIKGAIKNFPDKQKLKEYTTTISDLRKMLKGLLNAEK